MKTYQKAELIAKNLPTGSYAAGCPEHTRRSQNYCQDQYGNCKGACYTCEVAS